MKKTLLFLKSENEGQIYNLINQKLSFVNHLNNFDLNISKDIVDHIMTDNEPCGRLWGEVGDGSFDGGLYNMATLRYQHEEELRVWDRAIDDLFSGYQQIFTTNRIANLS